MRGGEGRGKEMGGDARVAEGREFKGRIGVLG